MGGFTVPSLSACFMRRLNNEYIFTYVTQVALPDYGACCFGLEAKDYHSSIRPCMFTLVSNTHRF